MGRLGHGPSARLGHGKEQAMAFKSWRGDVGVIKPTHRPGSLEEFIRLIPEGIGVVPIMLGITRGTVEEFTEGHVPGAWNVPVILFDQDGGGRGRNERFLPVVKATIPKDRRVIVGCRSGRRSAMAAELMWKAGYRSVFNMMGGFIGKRDAAGEWVQPGWSKLGYPTEKGDAGEVGYASLARRIPD